MTAMIIGILASAGILIIRLRDIVTRTWVRVVECIVYVIAWAIGFGIWSWNGSFLCGAIVMALFSSFLYNRFGDSIFYDESDYE